MKNSILYIALVVSIFSTSAIAQSENHRLIILADMGNEPDEMQQMIHMLMYSNEFDIEGLIAVTGKFLNPQQKRPYRRVLHPELFTEIIDGYAEVVENLKKHADGWPEPEYLHSVVAPGQAGYGIEDSGAGKSSEGSELIVRSFEKDDPRLIYIVVNAGSNTLAQALIDYQAKHSKKELNQLIAKLRVFENGAQDNSGAWICSKYPEIHWVRSNFQTYCYGGPSWDSTEGQEGKATKIGPYTWEPYENSGLGQHHWALTHVIGSHGQLGNLYPIRMVHGGKVVYLEGGGTIPWMGLIHKGLTDISKPHWGGWSGRYSKEKIKNAYSRHESVKVDELKYDDFALYVDVADKWINPETNDVYDNTYTPVWRWRRQYFNDFKCRMDWCVEEFENANHSPVASLNGSNKEEIQFITVKPGENIALDATGSKDPDNDELEYLWWIYSEAGTYLKPLKIEQEKSVKTSLSIPKNAGITEIHVILEIKDKNKIASLSDYRRLVVQVK